MVVLVDEDQISSFGFPPRERDEFWTPSLDPKNEEKMPNEFRSWRRWSNQLDKEQEMKLLAFDMGSECTSCGSCAWDLIDTLTLKAIQCTSCGYTPTECGSSKMSSTRFSSYSHCSRPGFDFAYEESEGSEAEGPSFAEPSVPEEAEGIKELDFAATSLPSPKMNRRSGIQSVRQSMVQPVRAPRWFEQEEKIAFQFKLTPRGRSTATALPPAAADGSSSLSSSKPPNTATPSANRGGIYELGDDNTAWQRLLTSALFLIKEDNMPLRSGKTKVLDLGLANSRQAGGKHLVMKHQSGKEHEESVVHGKGEAKRIRWKVVVTSVKAKERGSLLPR